MLLAALAAAAADALPPVLEGDGADGGGVGCRLEASARGSFGNLGSFSLAAEAGRRSRMQGRTQKSEGGHETGANGENIILGTKAVEKA